MLLRHAGRLAGGGPPAVAEVISAAQGGDARAQAAIDDVAEWCGVGLRAIVNLFNPEIVVVFGGVTYLSAVLGRAVRGVTGAIVISPVAKYRARMSLALVPITSRWIGRPSARARCPA